jgi:hypothetical protein
MRFTARPLAPAAAGLLPRILLWCSGWVIQSRGIFGAALSFLIRQSYAVPVLSARVADYLDSVSPDSKQAGIQSWLPRPSTKLSNLARCDPGQ